ncbi:hypothetical protein ACD578_05265 [Microvirga sp. RSM25]|uniref:hypothetical protein n=1 Tax=Microvirga sp. RSM25 TaxID=3273802 RepID=UPI00384B2E8B
MTWIPSLSGRPIDLLRPRVEDVDFFTMATALSQINRFTGQTLSPVSVGQHLLIGCDIAPEALRPWWLLHDAPEERLNDTTAPVKETISALATQMFGPEAATIIKQIRDELERRHDLVIHQAAGLPLPTEEQKREIKRIDLIALATERRDFAAPQKREWFIDKQGVQPSKRIYRWRPPVVVADDLFERFRRYLPQLPSRIVA